MSDYSPRRAMALADALQPFADACRRIDAQYDQLASLYGEHGVQRPSSDDLSIAFSYGTLKDALQALEDWHDEVQTLPPLPSPMDGAARKLAS